MSGRLPGEELTAVDLISGPDGASLGLADSSLGQQMVWDERSNPFAEVLRQARYALELL